MKHPFFAALSLGAACLLAACAGPAPPSVPPPMTEALPKPPVTATPLILQPGHWDWSGSGYVWQPGQYVPSEGHSNLWLPGYWALSNSGWVWQPAHWQ
jgi:hypothetical protein